MKILIVNSDRSGREGEPINLGDAMLSDALAQELEARGHVVTVAEFGDAGRPSSRERRLIRGARSLLSAVRAVDAVVVGGGTLLQDDGSALGGLPRLTAVTSACAWVARRPLAYFGIGCDPVSRRGPRLLVRLAVWRRPAWVRDQQSLRNLQDIAPGARAVVGADAVMLSVPFEQAPNRRGALVALAGADAGQLTLTHVEHLRETNGGVSFIPMSQSAPVDDRAGLRSELAPFAPAGRIRDWRELPATFAGTDVVIASRMHALYLGMLTGARLVAVSSRPKVRAFAAEFGIPCAPSIDSLEHTQPALAQPDAVRAAQSRAAQALDEMVAELTHLTEPTGRTRQAVRGSTA